MSWMDIETLDKTLESFDLFGWIAYDCIEMRLTDCDFFEGKFRYFCAGKMVDVEEISFTPTHWMPIPGDPV